MKDDNVDRSKMCREKDGDGNNNLSFLERESRGEADFSHSLIVAHHLKTRGVNTLL